jgi:putative aldouronate transport system permease protein
MMGAAPVKWYQEEAAAWWPWILIALHIWKSMGYSMVIYLATINGIDMEMYEAAMIDGAGKWQQTRHITLPMLKPVAVMMFILATGRIFNSDFGLFYRTTRNASSLTQVYLTLDVYVYNSIFNNPRPVYGYISAAGALQSVLGCLTMLLANGIVRRVDRENALI